MTTTITFAGIFLPMTARRMIGKIADVTQTRRPRWLEDYKIIDIVDDADTGNMSADALEDFRAIDLVLRGFDKTSATNDAQYVIVECVSAVTAADVTRAPVTPTTWPSSPALPPRPWSLESKFPRPSPTWPSDIRCTASPLPAKAPAPDKTVTC